MKRLSYRAHILWTLASAINAENREMTKHTASRVVDGSAELHMQGRCGELRTTANAWDEYLRLAEQNGWQPENPPACYRADIGLEVSCRDAQNLAAALGQVMADLLKRETLESCPDLPERSHDLWDLIAFGRDGGFRIC